MAEIIRRPSSDQTSDSICRHIFSLFQADTVSMKNSICLRKVLLRPWLSKCLVSFNPSQIEKSETHPCQPLPSFQMEYSRWLKSIL